MSWILLGLLAPLLYTVVVFIDKYVVEHKVKDSRGMPMYSAITAALFGTTVWLVAGRPLLDQRNALLIVIAGIITMCGFALYFYALQRSDASYIVALLETTPVFVLILAALVLHEQLGWQQLIGFLLVFGAVIGLSIDKPTRRIRFDRPFWAIVCANVFFAVAAIVVKLTINLNGFVTILAYESWGLTIGGIILFLVFRSVRRAFLQSIRSVGRRTLAVMFANEGLFIMSKAITFLAISLGSVSLVSVLGNVQVFYSIVLGVLLTWLAPTVFHENIERQAVITKIVFSLVLCGGVICIGVS